MACTPPVGKHQLIRHPQAERGRWRYLCVRCNQPFTRKVGEELDGLADQQAALHKHLTEWLKSRKPGAQ